MEDHLLPLLGRVSADHCAEFRAPALLAPVVDLGAARMVLPLWGHGRRRHRWCVKAGELILHTRRASQLLIAVAPGGAHGLLLVRREFVAANGRSLVGHGQSSIFGRRLRLKVGDSGLGRTGLPISGAGTTLGLRIARSSSAENSLRPGVG